MSDKGFTLIELMVVVVIIGILAAIAIPNFMSLQNRTREAAVKSNMHTLQTAAEDFSMRTGGTYPVDENSTESSGKTFGGILPTPLKNPWVPSEEGVSCIQFGTIANVTGRCGYLGAVDGYTLTGYAQTGLISLTLSPGSAQ